MLAIRLQRLGRKKVPVYRVAVQDARLHPSSGRVVTYIGSYDPHTKKATLNKEKAEFYLKNGAQPTPRVVSILKSEKVTVPKWVRQPDNKKKSTRNPEKLRKNQPKDAPKAKVPEVDETTPAEPEAATEQPAEPVAEPPAEAPAAEAEQEAPATDETAEPSEESTPEK
ncbi:MAG TPA: 30S ribosomal protein S16 [Candidatus Saccharimonadales bacterium]|nr:30S ribosomal protein S16 [Candidatus Saccharimonadales bacterium]